MWTANDLVLLSGLSRTEVNNTLNKLEALGLIESLDANSGPRFAATSLTEKPLFPGYEDWYLSFCSEHLETDAADRISQLYARCGLVLLAALLAGTKDERVLSPLTSFPEFFVAIVINMANEYQFWFATRFLDLRHALLIDTDDLTLIKATLDAVVEQFFVHSYSPGVDGILEMGLNGWPTDHAPDVHVDEAVNTGISYVM